MVGTDSTLGDKVRQKFVRFGFAHQFELIFLTYTHCANSSVMTSNHRVSCTYMWTLLGIKIQLLHLFDHLFLLKEGLLLNKIQS